MKILSLLLVLMLSNHVFAKDEPKVRLGVVLGNVGFLDSVGDQGGNAIGVGGILGYNLSEELSVDLTYLKSSHDKVSHKELSSGVSVYLSEYDNFLTYVGGGVVFVTNKVDFTETVKDTAFGLYGALGVDVVLNKSAVVGLQGKYNKVFEQEKTLSTSQVVKVVEDNYSVLMRIMVQF